MILLAVIFFALAALGLGLIVYGDLVFWPRLVLVVTIPVVAFCVWQAAQPPSGWPSHANPPKTSEFLWANVREPDELSHDRGEIDLWLVPPGKITPRSYREPYSRRLHEQTQAAMRVVKAGVRVGVRMGAIRKGAHQRQPGHFVFYVLPPPAAPAKD